MNKVLSASPEGAQATRWLLPLATALLLLVFTAPNAWAQNAQAIETIGISGLSAAEYTGTLPTGTSREVRVNIANCQVLMASRGDTLAFRWDFKNTPGSGPQYVVKFQRRTEPCSAASLQVGTDQCLRASEARPLSSSVSVNVSVEEFFGPELDGPDKCNDPSLGGNFSALLVFEEESITSTSYNVVADTITLNMNLLRPNAPSGVTASAGERGATVRWDSVTAASYYEVYVSKNSADLFVARPEDLTVSAHRADGTSREVSGLETGETYYAIVVSVDDFGNRSMVSEATEFETVPTDDFWEIYKGAGGVEAGGCTQAGGRTGAPWGFALGALLVGLLIRRRRVLVPLVLSALLLPALQADAQIVPYDPDEDIVGAFEVKLGAYTPRIDDEFVGVGPYEATFGGHTQLMLEVEGDWQFWQGFGSLGLFGSLGWSQVSAPTLGPDGAETDDLTRLRLLPIRAGIVYRFDILPRLWRIPFVFSFKLGLDYVPWFVTGGGERAEFVGDDGTRVPGRGATWGYHGAFGFHLLLDQLAPRMASTFRASSGIDNTYLFAEFVMARIDNFGSATSWDIGSRSWQFGLAFEF